MAQQQGQPYGQQGATTADLQLESAALQRISWFAILQISALVAVFVGYLAYLPGILSFFFSLSPGTSPSSSALSSFLQGTFNYLAVVLTITLAIQVVGVFILLGAFRRLSRIDKSGFSTPSILTVVLLVAQAAAGIGLIPLFLTLSSVLSQAAQTPANNPFTAGPTAGFLAALTLIIIGGVLSIVGVIGGEILGLWRVGARYDSTIIKLGGIFIIIPLLNYVGPILLLVGSLEARKKLRS